MAEVVLTKVERVFPAATRALEQFRLGPLDLTLPDGKLTVLVGPSGCGKTTILRLIAGLDRPTGGQISIGGKSVERVPPRHRDVAMVFQDHALYPQMTVFANLAFPLKMRRLPRAEIRARVRQAALWLDLEPLLDRRPAQLSGGQQQRVALGRAIVRRPQVSLLDEPLAHLDAPLRAELRELVGGVQRRLGLAMLYVTHDQSEATAIGDSLVVLNQGRIEQVAPPEEIYEAPANRFVAGFFGAARMNFLDGLLERRADRGRFVSDRGFALPISAASANAVPPGVQRVTLGIWPQDIRLEQSGERPGGLPATVESVQLSDGRYLVRLATHGCRIVVDSPTSVSLKPGDAASLDFPVERLFLFDPSGSALAAPRRRL
jgi:ABC-type sugar transport system ATPase subunit